MVSIVPIAAWLAVFAAAAIAVALGPRPVTQAFVIDRLLRYLFVFPVGLVGLWAFMGHVFFPEQAAAAIGWQTSPFQYEVGVANLGIGVAGLYAAFRGFQARLAVALMVTCFLGGAAIGHIRDMVQTGNMAPGNAGPIFYSDIFAPLLILVLLWLVRPGGLLARA